MKASERLDALEARQGSRFNHIERIIISAHTKEPRVIWRRTLQPGNPALEHVEYAEIEAQSG